MTLSAAQLLDLATFVLAAVGAGSIAFGLRYLFAKSYLSYHAELVGLEWEQVPTRFRPVILGMLKIVGAGMLSFGGAMVWLMVPLRRGESWSQGAILYLVLVQGLISICVTLQLRRVNPRAKTNVAASCAGVVLALVALAIVHWGL